jgi:succinate dehydrogenase / fumarate reductase, cytochrome b subunit
MSASITNVHFLLRRVHSLLGLVPVGAFLCFHLWENSQARFGQAYYNEYIVEKIQGMNYVTLLEIFVIALPILFHAIYGTVIWWYGKTNVLSYTYGKNWMWVVQRLSGFGIFAFLVFHVGWTRIWAIWNESIKADMFSHMQRIFENPVSLVAYGLGMTLAVIHLANGIWTMGITWGVTTNPRSQLISRLVTVALGAGLLFFGFHGMYGFFQDVPTPHPFVN